VELMMKVGNVLMGGQLDQLPVGSVVVLDEADGFNSVTRTPSGFTWVDGRGPNSFISTYGHGGISTGDWTLVHLPAVPSLKVGDVIETEEQAKALPDGTVVVDTEGDPVSAPAIKIENDRWLFRNVGMASGDYADNETVTEHEIVYIPARADTGAGSTAA
jgi:hypothetical protein